MPDDSSSLRPTKLRPENALLINLRGKPNPDAMAVPDPFRVAGSVSMIGQVLGGCRILKEIGYGGMGVVYQAEHLRLRKLVAIKLMNQQRGGDPLYVRRFVREAKLAGSLEHANIVQIHDVGKDRGRYFIIMQHIEGETVASLVKKAGALDPLIATQIVGQVANALDFADKHGVVHRDIKPENLLLTPDGIVKVADFGLARLTTGDSGLTSSGQILGTPLFMSPEQGEGVDVDIRSDIYALGATYYFLVTGRPPFQADTPMAILMMHKTQSPQPPNRLNASIPFPVSYVILRCLAKRPEERYQTPGRLIEDLGRILAGEPVGVDEKGPASGITSSHGALLNEERVNQCVVEQKSLETQGLYAPPLGELMARRGFLPKSDPPARPGLPVGDTQLLCGVCEWRPLSFHEAADLQFRCSRCGRPLRSRAGIVAAIRALALVLRVPADPVARPVPMGDHLLALLHECYDEGWKRCALVGVGPGLLRSEDWGGLTALAQHFVAEGGWLAVVADHPKVLGILQSLGADFYIRLFATREALEENIAPPSARATGEGKIPRSSAERAVTRAPDRETQELQERVWLLEEEGKLDAALALASEALKRRPSRSELGLLRAGLLVRLERWDEALQELNRAVKHEESNARALGQRGAVLVKMHRFEDAVRDLNRAIELKPDYLEALNNRALARQAMCRWTEMKRDCEQMLRLDPDSPRAHNNLGIAFMELKDSASACRHLERAQELAPDWGAPRYNRACLAAKEGRELEALEWVQRAVERGFRNWRLMEMDKDLASIRERPEFKEIVSRLKPGPKRDAPKRQTQV